MQKNINRFFQGFFSVNWAGLLWTLPDWKFYNETNILMSKSTRYYFISSEWSINTHLEFKSIFASLVSFTSNYGYHIFFIKNRYLLYSKDKNKENQTFWCLKLLTENVLNPCQKKVNGKIEINILNISIALISVPFSLLSQVE